MVEERDNGVSRRSFLHLPDADCAVFVHSRPDLFQLQPTNLVSVPRALDAAYRNRAAVLSQ